MRRSTSLSGRGLALVALILGFATAGPALAFDGLVEKKSFEMPAYTTVKGKTIADVRVGWESYGTLNAAKDNAILITHFFSGNSHAAGKYTTGDPRPGYWDHIIGSGKPIDTDKYYVISSDTLVNMSPKLKTVITTGPASINPATNKPYGMDFPIVTIRDFVNVQKALLQSQGIKRLHAVMGASMGALQAIEWAAAYPEMVERVIPVIGAGEADAWLIGWLNIWAAPVKLDPNWNGGDYYGRREPVEGLAQALKIVTLQARHPAWAAATFGRKWAAADKDPAEAMENKFAIEQMLDKASHDRAAISDANHFLYLVKANQLFVAGHGGSLEEGLKRIKAPMLLLPAAGDLLLYPQMSRRIASIVEAQGGEVKYMEIQGNLGHLDGVATIGSVGAEIAAFLAK